MDKELVPHCNGIFLIDLDRRVRSVTKYGPNTGEEALEGRREEKQLSCMWLSM